MNMRTSRGAPRSNCIFLNRRTTTFTPPSSSNILMARRFLSITFALWLGGLGCVLGCAPGAFAAEERDAASESNASTAVSCTEHACCQTSPRTTREKPDTKTASLEPHPVVTGAMSCCALAGQTADTARKSPVDGGVAPVPIARTLFVPSADLTATSFAQQTWLPDRGGTYLRCCVFLI